MSNELTNMGSELVLAPLPGGKAVDIINAPLRAIAPTLRVIAQCRPELDELCKEKEKLTFDRALWDGRGGRPATVYIKEAKLIREKLLPRAVQVRQAFDVLSSICDGQQNIDAPTALKMLSVLQRVLIKKKDDPVTLMAFAGLFDQEIDDLGVSLSLWKEVPRHPVVVALAIHRLFHKQVFAPAPAELCSACRVVANSLKNKRRQALWWLDALVRADFALFEQAPDAWTWMTSANLEAAAAFSGFHGGGLSEELIAKRNVAIEDMRMHKDN